MNSRPNEEEGWMAVDGDAEYWAETATSPLTTKTMQTNVTAGATFITPRVGAGWVIGSIVENRRLVW